MSGFAYDWHGFEKVVPPPPPESFGPNSAEHQAYVALYVKSDEYKKYRAQSTKQLNSMPGWDGWCGFEKKLPPPEQKPGQTWSEFQHSPEYLAYREKFHASEEYQVWRKKFLADGAARREALDAGKIARENLVRENPNANPQEISVEPEEDFDSQDTTEFPDCPTFTGPLTDLAGALYPSISLEFKQISLIARWGLLRSGLDRLKTEPHIQPRFYVSLISLPNRGKTAAINESRIAMHTILDRAAGIEGQCGRVQDVSSIDSGPALVAKFFSLIKTSPGVPASGKIMLDPDELSDVFEKGRSSGTRVSTLFTEFLKLHSGNRTGNETKGTGDMQVTHAHLSILGGATVDRYTTLWMGTGAGGDGLMSRFVPMTTNTPQVPVMPLQTDTEAAEREFDRLAKLAMLPGQEITFNPDAATALTEWWSSVDSASKHATRVLEMVKQLLIVLAVTNAPEGHTGTTLEIGPELTRQAIAFGNYVISVRQILNPADSWSVIQGMENHIIAWMKKNSSVRMPKSFNDARRGIRPDRKPGGFGVFKLGWGNCVAANVLKLRDKSQRAGKFSL